MIRKLKNLIHALEANVANILYGRPTGKIATIGVTGTDGKTTTASLIFHVLKVAGFNPSMITTVAAQIGDETYDTGLHTTTPSAFTLQKYIRKAVDAKSDYLVLEVTSHALDQKRIQGIDFKIGVLTNITHDHLDYHKTQENYVKAKAGLFKRAQVAILNMDDELFDAVRKLTPSKIYTYSLKKNTDFNLKNIGIKLHGKYEFNFENFMAAISVAKLLNISNENIVLALSTFKFPTGRQEIVYDQDFQIVIDFAHTPNAFERVLPALIRATKGRLIHVFGSAGERDASKRPLMGSISAKYSNVIILTSEDTRSEKIEDINAQIRLGIKDYKGELLEIADRQEAIVKAIRIAQKGDTILITGKGHEQSMNLGHGEIPWSEHDAVERALKLANRE